MRKDSYTHNDSYLIFHKDNILLRDSCIFFNEKLPTLLEKKIIRNIKLNEINIIELVSIEESFLISRDSKWMPVRDALGVIDKEHFSLIVRGLSILKWDKNHKYCGLCRRETVVNRELFERHCPECQINCYPRISPAIIVLIHRDEHILMARGNHHPPGIYGLIAGFVETGETLEQAVHREVFEEIGIKVKNLSYYGSQPWPFPDSLMVGFIAEYESGEIVMDSNEIAEAGWYRVDQLPGMPSSSISIAFEMINNFKTKK